MRPRSAARRVRAVRAPAVAVLVVVAGCSLFWDAPSVRIADVRVSGIGISGATADVVLEVANPNGFSLTSKRLRYRLEFEDPDGRAAGDDGDPWRTVAEGESVESITVPEDDTSRITLGVPFRYDDVGRAVVSFLREGRLRYRLRGDVLFEAPLGEVRVPFDDSGQVGL